MGSVLNSIQEEEYKNENDILPPNMPNIKEQDDDDDEFDENDEKNCSLIFPDEIFIVIFEFFNKLYLQNIIQLVCKKFRYFSLMSHHEYKSDLYSSKININDLIDKHYCMIFWKVDISQSNIYDDDVELISENCKNMSELNISSCFYISLKAIENLVKSKVLRERLKVLKFYKTEICNDEQVFVLLNKFRVLEEIWFDLKVYGKDDDNQNLPYRKMRNYYAHRIKMKRVQVESSNENKIKKDQTNLLLDSFCEYLKKYKKIKRMTIFVVDDHEFQLFKYMNMLLNDNNQNHNDMENNVIKGYLELRDLTMVNLKSYVNLKDVFPKLTKFAIVRDLRYNSKTKFMDNCDFDFEYLPITIEKLRFPFMKTLRKDIMMNENFQFMEELVISQAWELDYVWKSHSGHGYNVLNCSIDFGCFQPVLSKLRRIVMNERYEFKNVDLLGNLGFTNLVKLRCYRLRTYQISEFLKKYGKQLIELEIEHDYPKFEIGSCLDKIELLILWKIKSEKDIQTLSKYPLQSLKVFKFSSRDSILYSKSNFEGLTTDMIFYFIERMENLQEFRFLDHFSQRNSKINFEKIREKVKEKVVVSQKKGRWD